MVMVMARILINCGKFDEAIDELEFILSLESITTPNSYKLFHWMDPIRDNQRFIKLLERYKLKNSYPL